MIDNLYVRQNVAASGQSEITTEIQGKNQKVSLFKFKSKPFDNTWIGSNNTFKHLWKVSRTATLKLFDFFGYYHKILKLVNNLTIAWHLAYCVANC